MFDNRDNFPDYDCPNCGAQLVHHKATGDSGPPEWFGIGPHESCSLCGADYEHSLYEEIPLAERSISYLLQLLKQVESVYTGQKDMSEDNILNNRKYFQSIADALVLVNKTHIPDRLERWHSEQHTNRLINLYAQVHGGSTTRGLIKYSDFFHSLTDKERSTLIIELEENLAQKQCDITAER